MRAIATLARRLPAPGEDVGGGLQLSTSQAFQFNRAGLEMPDLQRRSPLGREARIVNMTELGKALTELDSPPVKAMVVYNSNPAAIAPNQNLVLRGLRREDLFTVVLEQFQTDTADYADILLPATTFLEHTDLYFAYGHYYLQLARPVIDAARRSALECRRISRARVAHGLRRRLFPRLRRRHDSRRCSDSGHPFLGWHHARASRRGAFRSAQCFRAGHALSAVRARRIRHASGKCEFGAEASRLHAARRIAARRRQSASNVSAGIGFFEKRRQHEFDLRQSRPAWTGKLRCCICIATDAGARGIHAWRSCARVQRSRQPDPQGRSGRHGSAGGGPRARRRAGRNSPRTAATPTR